MPGPEPQIRDIDILRVFVTNPDPAFVSSEVAEELDCTMQGARHQMEKLVERGLLARKKPGSSTVLYWLTPDGHQYYSSKHGSS
jgi:predicted ArsR family transcriptional regulator